MAVDLVARRHWDARAFFIFSRRRGFARLDSPHLRGSWWWLGLGFLFLFICDTGVDVLFRFVLWGVFGICCLAVFEF